METFNRLIAFLIACVAAMISVIALWQGNSTAMDAQSSRDFQRYGLEVLGLRVSGAAQVNFDYNRAVSAWQFFDLLTFNADQDDTAARARYAALREAIRQTTPLLQPPYFDPQAQTEDIARYEAERYLIALARLTEQFSAALRTKEAWNSKTNAYAIHQTLLSVSLFLLGLAVTLTNRFMRRLFAVIGVLIALLAAAAAFSTWAAPIRDLRQVPAAIDAYAEGIGLMHQSRYEDARVAFGRAISAAPDYISAYIGRATAADALDDLPAALADGERARALGDTSSQLASSLAWVYARAYRFDDSLRLYEEAVRVNPNEIWAYFDLGLVRLVSGASLEQVRAAYDQGAALASRLTAETRASGGAPPSYLWDAFDDASVQLDRLVRTLRQDQLGDEVFPFEQLSALHGQAAAVEALSHELKSLAASLEYYGVPPTALPTAKFSPLRVLDANAALAESFASDETALLLQTDYSGMRDGSDLLIKFFNEGTEDVSLRVFEAWRHGESGTVEIEISSSEGGAYAFRTGLYVVELYVDGQFMASGRFIVE